MIFVAFSVTRALGAPTRLVVLDFDGRAPLAERGHTLVVALLAEHHDLVPSKRWQDARAAAAATLHGPAQWERAAHDAGVDAVIEGWVADDHGRATLSVLVRNAHDSTEVTTTTVRFDTNGTIAARGNAPFLDAIEGALATIEPEPEPEPAPPEPLRASRLDIAPPPKREHQAVRAHAIVRPASVPPAPDRFAIEGGGYVGSRSLTLNAAGAMPFSGVATHGVQAHVEVEPVAGIALDGSAYRSLGSSLTFVDVTDATHRDLAIDQHGWELAVAYRRTLDDAVSVAGALSYGAQAFAITAPPPSFAVPDTRYAYVAGGARVDVRALDALTLGGGARYIAVLDTGAHASAHGVGLDGMLTVALPAKLFVRGQLAYRRISIGLSDGSGTDSQLTFHLNLGVTF